MALRVCELRPPVSVSAKDLWWKQRSEREENQEKSKKIAILLKASTSEGGSEGGRERVYEREGGRFQRRVCVRVRY